MHVADGNGRSGLPEQPQRVERIRGTENAITLADENARPQVPNRFLIVDDKDCVVCHRSVTRRFACAGPSRTCLTFRSSVSGANGLCSCANPWCRYPDMIRMRSA